MASTTVNTTGFDVNAVMSTKAVSTSKKATESTQDFGSVLSSTTQNSKSDNNYGNAVSTKDVKTTTSDTSDNKVSDTKTTDTKDDSIRDDAKSEVRDAQVSDEPVSEDDEIKADDTTVETIVSALTVILEQIKELIGADEDQVSMTLEDMGLDVGDLLDSNNMADLVALLSGEDSTISLVANEDLYSKLQTLTDVVDTQLESVLEVTGLSEEDLAAVLESLADENPVMETVAETVNTMQEATPSDNAGNAVNVQDEEVEPQVIVEDNTTKPATTYSKLPENQQDTSNLKNDTGSDNSKTEKNTDNESKSYSETNGFNQNQNTTLNENVSEVADTTTSYKSEDAESIMRQLADAVKIIKDDNQTQMELSLHPASLGTVNINLITKGGAVTAQFTAQSEQVRAAIESQVATLQQNLEAQGIKVEAIEVAVESHGMERNLDEDNSRREKEGEQEEESMRATRRANINLRDLGESGDVLEEIQGADEATRIAMEMMSANGNVLDMHA